MAQKIVLIFPACNVKVFGSNEKVARPEKAVSPPLGLLYLATELISAGYAVECCDYNAEKYSEEHLSLLIRDADIVGVSVLSFNRTSSHSLIQTVRRLVPSLPIIAGGADCILHRKPVPGTVLTVVEEAETIIVDIVAAVLENRPFSELSGVVFTDGRGMVRQGRPFRYPRDLDFIKFPNRALVRDNKGYSIIGKRSREVATIITSRGCPRHCTFCAHGAIAYQRYRARSPENVLREIEIIAAQGYRLLGIVDDNFTADKARARSILQGIIDREIKMTIAVQGRVDAADFDLFCLMRQAGVRGITFGLESGNQAALDFYNKGTTVAMNERAVRLADKAGLYTGGIFIFGAPMEKASDFQRTYRFAASLPLDVTTFWILDYTYGSTLWQRAFEQGRIAAYECNVPAGIERGTSPYSTRFIEKFAQDCFFHYYRRPGYWLRQAVKLARIRDRYFLSVLAAGIGWVVARKMEMALSKLRLQAGVMRAMLFPARNPEEKANCRLYPPVSPSTSSTSPAK